MERFDCLIIGAGPCGIGTALKLQDAGVNFGIIDGGTPGGKVNIAPRVDNYPGFKQIPGPDLAFKLFERLMDKGISIIGDSILSLTKEGDLFKLEGQFDSYDNQHKKITNDRIAVLFRKCFGIAGVCLIHNLFVLAEG